MNLLLKELKQLSNKEMEMLEIDEIINDTIKFFNTL